MSLAASTARTRRRCALSSDDHAPQDLQPCERWRLRLSPRWIAAALIAALAAGHSYQIRAQPADGLRAQIAAAVAAEGALPHRASPDHGAAQALRAAYAGDANAPFWSRDGHATSQAEAVLGELRRAGVYGLRAEDYSGDSISTLAASPAAAAVANDRRWGQFDVQLSAAALRFMSDLHYGRVDPAAAGFKLTAPHHILDLAAALEGLARASDVKGTLVTVEPPFHHYKLLKDALAKYLELAQHPELTNLPAAPAGLKPGGSYAGAPALRRLLLALGDLPAGSTTPLAEPTFDADLSAGVRTFQQRHGLTVDGLLGKTTFAALTTPLARRVLQINLTLERWRWLPPFQTPPIIVNIPQFRLFAFRTTEDRVKDILEMDVIVGRTYPRTTQTPVFEGDMHYVVIRPYWDVPYALTKNEMLPKIRANPHYLAGQHLEIVSGQQDSSPAVPPTPENIEALAAGRLRLRQEPGEDNALGLFKFIFPNSYNVYLHSTPAHQLFKEARRDFSHGCIRLSDPLALAVQVLKDAPGGWTREKIEAAMHGTSTVRINLAKPINVLILYGTALATEAGPTMFFEDIYGHDQKLENQLGLASLR
jgi:murein L,D-transpeptidase YcbB/YkuD